MQASERQPRRTGDRRRLVIACAMLAAGLGGCVETTPDARAGRLDVRAAIARGDMHSPKAAAVALSSIDGAPEPVVARLRRDMASEAAGREITITDPALARYFLRGYIDAYPTDKGTAVHYVWDVFDSARQRTRRLDDGFDVPAAAGSDPWDSINDEILASVAARSADDLAAYLATTPEAADPAAAGPAALTAAAGTPVRPVN